MRSLIFGVAALAVGALAQACSSSSSPSAGGPGEENGQCVDNPNACPAGTTCWPAECADPATCVPKLECLSSHPGKLPHDPCENTLGTPTCSDHQACVQFQGAGGGCVVYCDDTKDNHACQPGETCLELKVGQAAGAPSIRVCIYIPPADAGPDVVVVDDGGGIDGPFDVVRFTRVARRGVHGEARATARRAA